MGSEKAEYSAPQSSGGIFAFVVPIYTIGIVIFFVYTIFKVGKLLNNK